MLLCLVFAAQSQIKVACIGNSITQGVGVSDPSTQAYPAVLQTLLGKGYSVQNDGVSGTTMLKNGDNPYWKNGKLSSVFGFLPNVVTIKLGTNDTKPQNWGAYNTQFRKDYETMIDTLNTLSTKPRIFLVLPVPVWANSYGIRDSALQKIMVIVKQITLERGLPVIDCNTPLKPFQAYFSDGVHPNAAGADTIAQVMYRSVAGAPAGTVPVLFVQVLATGALPFRLFLPENYSRSQKYPLVLALHGEGESGTDNVAQVSKNRMAEIWAEDTVQQKQKCFVVSPQCPVSDKWVNVPAWTNDFYSTQTIAQAVAMTLTLKMVDSLVKAYPIDTNRLYVTGISMGGYGTWDLIARYPGKFAAAIPVSGGNDTGKAAAMKNVPVWAFHGAMDPTVPPNADRSIMQTLFPALGLPVTSYTTQYTNYFVATTMNRTALSTAISGGAKKLYCEYTDGVHDIWAKTFNEPLLTQWLFLQRRGAVAEGLKNIRRNNAARNNGGVYMVINGNDVSSLFSTLKPGNRYNLSMFDARGVRMKTAVFDASSSSKKIVEKMLDDGQGVKWVRVK